MKPASALRETGWLPDCVFIGDRFEHGVAFFADEQGRITRFSREPADHERARRLEGQAALPGLVLAHSQCLRRLDRGHLSAVDATHLDPADVYDAARMAFLEMVLSGVTCVGEAGLLPGVTVAAGQAIMRAAADVGLRLAYLHGGAVSPRWREELETLRSHVAAEHPGDLSWLGIQIFNAAGLPLDQLKDIAAYGHAQRFRLQYHPDESQADEAWISWLGRNALLDKRVTVMLGGELGAEEERQLASTRAMACVCPLSRRRSTLAAAGLERLRAAGLEVAVGLADHVRSNALEVLRSLPSGLPPVERLRLATAGGARSLGAPSGALEVGRPADFLTVNLYEPSLAGSSSEGLLAAVLEAAERRAIREVWIGARPRVNNGRHVQQGPIVGKFVELQQRLRAAAAGPGRD